MGYNGDSASVGGDLASLPSLAREGVTRSVTDESWSGAHDINLTLV